MPFFLFIPFVAISQNDENYEACENALKAISNVEKGDSFNTSRIACLTQIFPLKADFNFFGAFYMPNEAEIVSWKNWVIENQECLFCDRKPFFDEFDILYLNADQMRRSELCD